MTRSKGINKKIEISYLNIRSIRINKGLTIKELAEMTGIPISTTTQIMSNNRPSVMSRTLEKFAKALDVDISILIKDSVLPPEFYPIPYTMVAHVNSEIIRAYRRKFNLSRRLLAEKCCFTKSCLNFCENEDKSKCTWENLFSMAKVFGVSPLSLLATSEWPADLAPCLNYIICPKSSQLHKYKKPLLPIGKLFVKKGYHLHDLTVKSRSKPKTKLAISTIRNLFWGLVLPSDETLSKLEKITDIFIGEMKYAFTVSVKIRELNKVTYPSVKV